MNRTTKTEPISICQTDQLTDQQITEIQQLVSLCREKDNISLSYPAREDGTQHYLLYCREDTSSAAPVLRSVLSVLPCETEAECIAFTHPDWRKHGYFTELLELALETFEDCDILFPVNGSCPDTMATLDALGAELESQELQMELELQESQTEPGSPAETDNVSISDNHTGSALCTLIPLNRNHSGDCDWELRSACTDAQMLFGTCQTALISDACICLHHVEILPQFRKKGYGTALLTRLLSALRQTGIRRVILQVSGTNEAALALYKKQGFRITETLSYYLY